MRSTTSPNNRSARLLTSVVAFLTALQLAFPDSPEIVASETVASETVASETVASETVASETVASETVASETVAQEKAAWKRPAEAEVDQFVEDMLQAIHEGDSEQVNELVDWTAILARATSKVDAPKTAEAFSEGFLASVDSSGQLASELIRVVKEGGSYTALNRRVAQGFGRATFRLILPAGGFNYHDFAIVKQADGKTRAVDIYVFLSGETMSVTLRRSFLPAAASEDRALADKLTDVEEAYIRNGDDVQRFTAAIQSGDIEAGLRIFKAFPDDLKKDKNLLILRLAASQRYSDKAFARAINDFAKYHPNDPCMNMLSIDAYMLQKDYDNVIKAVDGLQRLVGNDPYLKLIKATVYENKGDLQQAKRLANEALQEEDRLLDAHWSVLGFALQDQDHGKTLELLKSIDQKFSIGFKDLRDLPDYANFVNSDEFVQWNRYLKTKPVDKERGEKEEKKSAE